jgi:hypothetical protein
VWVPHLSERIHSIGAKTKPNIPWIIGEILLMVKVKIFPLPTIRRKLNLSICLSLHMPKDSWASLGLENKCFKWSIIVRYHIIRVGTFLSLDP